MWDARTKWKDFGGELGVDHGTLESIAISERDNAGNCLREMLANWLRGSPSSEGPSSKPRTWVTIVDALRAKAVDCGAVADEIERNYNVRGSVQTATPGGTPQGNCFSYCQSIICTPSRLDFVITSSIQLLLPQSLLLKQLL